MSPPRVLGTACVQTSSLVGVFGSGNTDRSDPGSPPGWELTYQVRPPLLVARLSRSVMVMDPESCSWPTQIPAGDPIPAETHGSPRAIALLTAWSGSPAGHVEV